jgi:hypothetical protein
MNDSLSHLSNSGSFSLDRLLTIIGVLLGVFGLLWGFFTWYASKKKEKLYQKIFDAASNSLKSEETEAVLKTKQTELSNVSIQLEEIRQNIPIEARRTLIIDRLDHSQHSLHTLYQEVISLQNELQKIDKTALKKIPEEFLNKIQNAIEPKYKIKERLDNLKTTLTILTTLASISFALIPEFGRYLGVIFFILAIPVLFKLIKESATLKGSDLEVSKIKFRIQGEAFVALALLGVWIFSLAVSLDGSNSITRVGWNLLVMTNIFTPILLGVVFWDIFRLNKKRKQISNNQIASR